LCGILEVMNKKSALVIAAVIVIVIILFVAQSGQQNGQAPSTTSGTPSSSSLLSASSGVSFTPVVQTSSVWQVYSGAKKNLLVSYPPGWSLGGGTPISMDNFGHEYLGGAIPSGGAEIDVATTTIYGTVESFAAGQLSSATNLSTTTVSVSGVSCLEYSYNNQYSPAIASKNIATYCKHNGVLFEFYLSYRADDSKGSQYPQVFKDVLSRVQFTN
jgi:hypothetical protein